MRGKAEVFRELGRYLWANRRWWLGTVILLLAALGALVVLTEGTALAPFIYAIF